jgi:hypothetical protein
MQAELPDPLDSANLVNQLLMRCFSDLSRDIICMKSTKDHEIQNVKFGKEVSADMRHEIYQLGCEDIA